jgi:hypothetical protein
MSVEPRRCPACRRMTVEGADARTGLPVRAESQPLSKLGEALALLAGRGTFSLQRIGGQLEIAGRDQFSIRGQPAGTKGVDVLVRHDCQYDRAELPRMRTNIPSLRTAVPLPADPPY